MHFIPKEQYHLGWDKARKPVLTVKPGETVVFETYDTCYGRVRSREQYLAYRESGVQSNPLTGPVAVEGAEPGHTLVIELLKIELDATGFQLLGPNRAIVKDEYPDWMCYEVRVENNQIILPTGVRLPANPVIGAFGVAPAAEPSRWSGPWGGNLDVPEVCAGARIHLPIEVSGGLFSMADVHARQGDGEVVGAPEIGAKITARFDLIRKPFCDWCMIEDATHWHTIVPNMDEFEAIRAGTFHNGKFIAREHNIALHDALILLTMTNRLQVSRTFGWGPNPAVICCSFPKAVVRDAVKGYRRA